MRFFPYRYHKNARYGKDGVDLESIPERVTYLSFEEWKTLYHGDPKNWSHFWRQARYASNYYYYLPTYKKYSDKEHYVIIYIKFKRIFDYQKYKRFIKKQEHSHEDYENYKEIYDLTLHIQKKATENAQETQKQIKKDYDNLCIKISNNNSKK